MFKVKKRGKWFSFQSIKSNLRGVFRNSDWIRWIVDGFGLIVSWTVGGWRSTGEDDGSAVNFPVTIGESALFDGANGRFFKIEVLFALTETNNYRDGWSSSLEWLQIYLPSLASTGGVGRRFSSSFSFGGIFFVLAESALVVDALLPAGRSGVPCFAFLLSCVS